MKRVVALFIALLAFCWSGLVQAQTFTSVATDDFNRANETPLSGSGNWTNGSAAGEGTWNLSSNAAHENSAAADSFAFYSGGTFNANQYSKGALSTDGTGAIGAGVGLIVRRSAAGTQTHYEFICNHRGGGSNCTLARRVAGAYTSLSAWTQTFTDTDIFILAVETSGSNQILRVYRNGTHVTQGTATAYTDANTSVTSGKPGLGYSSATGTTAATLVDNWEGGNFSSSSRRPAPPIILSWLWSLLTPWGTFTSWSYA